MAAGQPFDALLASSRTIEALADRHIETLARFIACLDEIECSRAITVAPPAERGRVLPARRMQ